MENYFSLLGLAPVYAMDISRLEHAYQEAMATCHPDRHQTDPLLQLQAERTSASLNLAYETLIDPLLRAQHLLALAGVEESEHTMHDSEFLMQQMYWREKLEKADADEQGEIMAAVKKQQADECAALAGFFTSEWQNDQDMQQKIQQSIGRAKYWKTLVRTKSR